MRIEKIIITSILFLIFFNNKGFTQNRIDLLKLRLEQLAVDVPQLNDKIDLSVSGVSLQDFIRAIANSNNLNLSVDASINEKVFNNFSKVPIIDVLLFVCNEYNLDINFIGPIMSVNKYVTPVQQIIKPVQKAITISYDQFNKMLSTDLNNDSIQHVTRSITKATGKNILYSPDIANKTISGFTQNLPVEIAMEKLAFANNLRLTKTDENVFHLEKDETPKAKSVDQSDNKSFKQLNNGLLKVENDKISLEVQNTSISQIIGNVSGKLGKEYFLFNDLKGNATLSIQDLTYEDFLKYILNGTEYTFKKENNIYLIGDRNLEGLRETKMITLKFRTIEKVIDNIPPDLKKGVDIKPFPDLNSLIVSGSLPRIIELESFIRDIDRVVPVVVMEVFIVDVRDSRTLSTGLEAGLGKQQAVTGGKVFPDMNISLNSNSINEIIGGLNGLGLLNLGKVTPNFYFNLKLLESQGILKLRSTPRLATLNGYEAKMSIGRTEYYLEAQNTVVGTQNPQNIITQQYKSVNADLSLLIEPYVSGNEQITLKINVSQSNFTERISPNAPPGTISRDFQSLIRVRNEDMIILGGLEETSTNDAGSGLPVLSRIPVIKWLFSSRTKARSKSKLTIFLKASVIY